MADQRKGGIAWTEATWNPIRGCSKVSPGCDNCYALAMASRFSGPGKPFEGLVMPFGKSEWTGEVRFIPEHLADPLRWRRPRRIFVNSMSDLFHPGITNEQRAAVYGVMAACPQHTFQVLTKRPEEAVKWYEWVKYEAVDADGRSVIPEAWVCADSAERHLKRGGLDDRSIWPPPNLVLVATCEDQPNADERIPMALKCPAAVRGVSIEPMLGPMNISEYLRETRTLHLKMDIAGAIRNRAFNAFTENGHPISPKKAEAELRKRLAAGEKYFPMCDCPDFDPQTGCKSKVNPRLDWVIVGCESGPHRRSCDVHWILDIVRQCREANVPCFVKQIEVDDGMGKTRVSKDPNECGGWTKEIRVRMFPGEKWSSTNE